jgi:hypothetical protein
MHDVKAARQLASDITQSGAKLYDLLENENVERQERAKALRFLDLAASASGAICVFALCICGRRSYSLAGTVSIVSITALVLTPFLST